jgi:hypothetical protein
MMKAKHDLQYSYQHFIIISFISLGHIIYFLAHDFFLFFDPMVYTSGSQTFSVHWIMNVMEFSAEQHECRAW